MQLDTAFSELSPNDLTTLQNCLVALLYPLSHAVLL